MRKFFRSDGPSYMGNISHTNIGAIGHHSQPGRCPPIDAGTVGH